MIMKKTILTRLIGVVLCCLCLMAKATANDIDLCAYQATSAVISIGEIPADLSGVTYNPLTNTLFMVTNKGPNDSTSPTSIYETQTDGTVLRSILLDGFNDTEGIVHIGGTRFAVAEERRGNIAFFDILPSTSNITISYNDAEIVSMASALGPWGANNGLEGVSYHPATNTIYTVKEKSAVKYYAFPNPTSFPTTITNADQFCINDNIDINNNGLSDVAGMHHLGLTFNGNTDVLLLGDDDKTLIQVDEACNTVAQFPLDFMGQPEGVTMDNDGNIYIVGEPNQLVILSGDNTDTDNSGTPDVCETCSVGASENGDVNVDGQMDVVDALFIAQYSVGLLVGGDCGSSTPLGELCLPRADMNCDGEVNILDAYHIARCDVGIESEFCPN